MRSLLIPVCLAMSAPALAAPSNDARLPASVPPELTDPQMADKLARVATVLSKSLMTLPVGEVQAAIEGREPTAAERGRTVRDELGPQAAEVERELAEDARNGGAMMQQAMKALVSALPAMMKAMEPVAKQLEQATANLPSPAYPKR